MAAIKKIRPESKKRIEQIYHGTNCGLAIYGFPWGRANGADPDPAIGWDWFRKNFADGDYLNQLVVFSGNRNQSGPEGPHALAKWLIKQGEEVLSSRWTPGGHGGEIRAYVWHPSDKFRRKLTPIKKWGV